MIRFFDIVFSFLGLVLLSPLFLVLSVAIPLESRGGVFYHQVRVGKGGRDFRLHKFRSMRAGSDRKGLLTVGGRDSRITKVGFLIRKYKMDELPQLFNVLKGEMSMVGPRPEVRKYVDFYTPEQYRVLSVPPGITDYASIRYMDENDILARASDPDKAYVEEVMPDKIRYNMIYIENRTLRTYFRIIFLTLARIVR